MLLVKCILLFCILTKINGDIQSTNSISDAKPRAYVPDAKELDFVYHDYNEMTKFLRATSARYSNLTALYSIGKSVQGRDLWVMVVSSSPYEHMIGKPDVKYVGGIHGNEVVGKELLLHLIQVSILTVKPPTSA